jgi:gliding motility-associated-like protein
MKKIYLLLLVIIAAVQATTVCAQLLPPNQPEQDACQALKLCGNTFTSTYSYQGIGMVSDLTSCSCDFGVLAGEDNSMWLRLEILTGGSIVFTISPINILDDYDFAIVDITNTTCSTFTSSDVIRCNFNNNLTGSNVNGVVGLNTTSTITSVPAGFTGNSFLQQINANAGDVYLIMINNFGTGGGPSSGFTIDFTGSTAIFNDSDLPRMVSAFQPCNGSQQIYVPISESILCSSIEPSGSDFVLSGGGVITSATGINCSGATGYTDTVVLTLASALPAGSYTINIQNGTDGNTLLDLCNHGDTIPDQIQFNVSGGMIAYDQIVPPACYKIKIKLTSKALCSSVASDGSDFSISGPQTINIVSAVPLSCDAQNMSDSILLTLSKPITTDGTYTITSQNGSDGNTLVDNCGLSQATGDAISFSVNSLDGMVVAMPDTVLCDKGYLLLTATDFSPQPATYLWSPGTFVGDSTQLQTVAYISQPTQFTLLAVDKDGCPHRAFTHVAISERTPTLTPLEATICKGESITLLAGGGSAYLWQNDTATLSCVHCAATQAMPTASTVYSVQIADTFHCADTLTATVHVNELPVISITPQDTVVKYGAQIQLTVSGAMTYTWTPSEFLDNANLSTPIAVITEPVVFVAQGIDANGCVNSDSVFIDIDYGEIVNIPNAFTPNGDGKNDVFRLGNLRYQKLQAFYVFNRWGQEVFNTNDPKAGWDGTFKGQPQEMGVYNYVIQLAIPNGKVEVVKGTVTLIR